MSFALIAQFETLSKMCGNTIGKANFRPLSVLLHVVTRWGVAWYGEKLVAECVKYFVYATLPAKSVFESLDGFRYCICPQLPASATVISKCFRAQFLGFKRQESWKSRTPQ